MTAFATLPTLDDLARLRPRGGGLATIEDLLNTPDQTEDRRGAHPKFRTLVDEGPDAIEGELRDFLRQAPPEDVADNPRAWWQTALEVLDLPRNAVANLIAGAAGVEASSKESFAGLRKVYGSDLLRSMGWKPDSLIGKVGHFLTGLTLDFALDPLTWLTLGAGTVKTGATGATRLAADAERAARFGKGLTVAKELDAAGNVLRPAAHLAPEAVPGFVDRVAELERAAGGVGEAAVPLAERAAPLAPAGPMQGLSAIEQALAEVPEAGRMSGRFGVGVGTETARTMPLGHIVAGPAVIGAQAGGAITRTAGDIAEKVLSGIPVFGKPLGVAVGGPLKLAGAAVEKGGELLGNVLEKTGRPFAWLPEASAFKPYRELPVIGPKVAQGVDWIEKALASPAGRKVADVARSAAQAIGLSKSQLTLLAERIRDDALRGVRVDERDYRQAIEPLIRAASRDTGIAAGDLEPLWSELTERMGPIAAAAQSGNATRMTAEIDGLRETIAATLGEKYAGAKVMRATDDIVAGLAGRQVEARTTSAAADAESSTDPVSSKRALTGSVDDFPEFRKTGNAAPPVVDLNLEGTGSPYSMAYKAGVSGSDLEAKAYAERELTPGRLKQLRAELGLGESERAGSRQAGDAKIDKPAVLAGGRVFTGETHGEALIAAEKAGAVQRDNAGRLVDVESGDDIGTSGRADLFTLSNGGLIDRFTASERFNVTASENLHRAGGAAAVVFVPVPSTSGGGNRVPAALAERMARELGGQSLELLQSGTVRKRRAAGDKLQALANPRDFTVAEGVSIPDGARIVLVDDTMRTGGTLRDAASALADAGLDVAATVVGKLRKGGRSNLAASPITLAELRQASGGFQDALSKTLGRSIDTLTEREARTLIDQLQGASFEEVRRRIESAREIPLPAGEGPTLRRAAPLTRKAVASRLTEVYDTLATQGLVRDAEGESAALAARYGDVDMPLAPGYVFTPEQKGEAAALRAELRGMGRGDLVKLVRVRKPGEAAIAGKTGDEVGELLARAGEADPIRRMAEGMVAHAQAGEGTGRIQAALDFIESNPEGASPEWKDLARRWKVLGAGGDAARAARKTVAVEVPHERLALGDQVNIAGERYRVTEKNDAGLVLKDGVEIALQPGEPVMVDAGSHKADPIGALVDAAVAKLTTQGEKLSGANIHAAIDDALGSDRIAINAEKKRLLGMEKGKGRALAVPWQAAVEKTLLTRGVGTRGVPWQNLLARLEYVEAGRTDRAGIAGRVMTGLESHPLGAFITSKVGADGVPRRELTDLGREALGSMRAVMNAGGDPQQVARLMQEGENLGAQILNAKRVRATVPASVNQRFDLVKRVLSRMGKPIDDDPAWWAARVAEAPTASVERVGPPLPVPQPRDLFAEPVAAVLDEVLKQRGAIEAREQAKGIPAELTTERGLGYWPRILGKAKTPTGKLQRAMMMGTEAEWRRAAADADAVRPVGVDPRKSAYENFVAVLERENAARAKTGVAPIAVPKPTDDLAQAVEEILRNHADLGPGHRFQLQRTYIKEATIAEVNSITEHSGIAFQTDPVAVWLKRNYASRLAAAGVDFLQAVIQDMERTGLAQRLNNKGPVQAGFERIVDPKFGNLADGLVFSKEVVKEFQRFVKTSSDPRPILRGWDWATGLWRTAVLGVPAFSATNLLSGVFQANELDAFAPKVWSKVKRFMEDYHAGRNLDLAMGKRIEGLPADVAKLSTREFYDWLAVDHGVMGRGLYGVEMEGAVRDGLNTGWSTLGELKKQYAAWKARPTGGLRGKVVQAVPDVVRGYFNGFRAANVALEDWMSTSVIVERLRRGDAIDQALSVAKRAYQQSADLTDFERGTLRRLMPFWGWMKGNSLLQFMVAMDRPAMINVVSKIRGDLEASFVGDENLPPSLRPKHVGGELGVQLTGGTKPDFVNLTRVFPVKELGTTPLAAGNLPAAALDAVTSGLHPFLKSGLETAINRDLFWDRPIEEYDGQRKRFLGVDLPPGVKRAAQLVRPLNIVEQQSWRGMPTSPSDAAFSVAQGFGLRTFPVDIRRQVYEAERTLNDQLGAIMRDYKRARDRATDGGRDWRTDGEVKRLAELYRTTVLKREALPLKALRGAGAADRRAARDERKELKAYAMGA